MKKRVNEHFSSLLPLYLFFHKRVVFLSHTAAAAMRAAALPSSSSSSVTYTRRPVSARAR